MEKLVQFKAQMTLRKKVKSQLKKVYPKWEKSI